MRYLFLLLLITFLCTCARAQFTMTASIGLADEQCTAPITDPNTDCIAVPNGEDMLSYLPGQDGDIIITYRLTNNSGGTITMASVTDSDRGVIVPVSPITIVPGQTVTANRIFPAETLPRTVTATVTANVQNAAGASATVTGQYTLDVVAPAVDVEFGVARQADVCDNEPTAPNCNVPYGALNGQTITVGALDTFTTRFAWTNAGLSTFDMENLVDQDGFQVGNTGFDQVPGQTLISSRHWEAPALPGTYNYSQTLTVTDFAGNEAVRTVTFVVIVQAPQVSVEFGVARQADVCDNEPTAPNCSVPYGALNGQTITVGALDTFTTRYAWTNTGLGEYDLINLADQDDFQIANTGFDQEPGQTLISSRHWEAPALPGTYDFSQLLTITDQGGNMVTAEVTYIVIVEAPMVEIEFGVARQADVCDNEPTAPNCSVPYGALNGQTITVGALDTFTTRYAWTNTGLGDYDLINLADQDDFQIANTGFDQEPGQTLISSRHWEAPALPGTYNFSQLLTITDQGGNMVTAEVTYIVIVEAPMVEIEFGVARQSDVCDNTIAPNCPVPYGPVNSQTVTLGAGDTLTTRFAWTNTGLGDYDLINIVDQDGFQIANTGFDQTPGQTLISARHWEAPDSPGTYNWSQTLTITDQGGNVITETVTFKVVVDCSLGDFAPPTALCQDRTVTLTEGETVNINAGQIDDGSFDGCGNLAGGGIDISSFTCDDEGPNTVTLTVGDLAGNSASCTATVTVVVEEAISSGSAGNCVQTVTPVTGGQAWWDIEDPDGKLIAQVIVGNNTNISGVRAGIYTSAAMTETVSGNPLLSKRTFLQLLDGSGQVVQPNSEPLYVRLYYTEAEVNALLAADPEMGIGDLAIIKADGEECGSGYTGQNATSISATLERTGCADEDYYFEFFTGSFSTFYLFSNDALLPVELTTFEARAIEKQRVQLDWMTTTETDNDRFEIEHSVDGQTFTQLGAVAGAGGSSEEQWYDFVHETPVSGLNYYRLRQIDFDGTETLSEVRVVEVTGASQLSLYPNPTVDELWVKGFVGGNVRVLDAQGRIVLGQSLLEGQSLDVRALPSGIYLLQLPTETLRWVKR